MLQKYLVNKQTQWTLCSSSASAGTSSNYATFYLKQARLPTKSMWTSFEHWPTIHEQVFAEKTRAYDQDVEKLQSRNNWELRVVPEKHLRKLVVRLLVRVYSFGVCSRSCVSLDLYWVFIYSTDNWKLCFDSSVT